MDHEFIERVREQVDIVEVISEYIPLKRSGKSYKGLCPFHPDKTPSFYVDPEKGVYHCFGCGASGNVFRFIMEMEHVTFGEALIMLAKKYGIPIPERRSDKITAQLTEVTVWAQRLYMKTLFSTEGDMALKYLKGRRFKEAILKKFGVGYAPPSGNFLIKFAKSKKISMRLLEETGLVLKNENGEYYDYFRNRIIFPIKTASGIVVAFGGRGLAQNTIPKYINSPDTKIFKKGEIFFGLPEAKGAIREKEEVWIVEGYLDVLAMHQGGFENVVAPLGTALTERQSRLLSRFTKRAVLLFDGDEAGVKATRRSLPLLLKWSVVPKVGLIPRGDDPASLITEGKDDVVKKTVEKALDLIPFYFQEGYEEADTSIRKEMLEEVLNTIAGCPDPVLRALYLRGLSRKAGLLEDYLKIALRRRVEGVKRPRKGIKRKVSVEFKLLAYSLLDEELMKRVREEIDTIDIKSSRAKNLLELISSDMTKEEILAEINNDLREELIEVLINAPDIGAIKRRFDKFLLEKELEKHRKALLQSEKEGDKIAIETHLMEIKRIKSLLGGKGGI